MPKSQQELISTAEAARILNVHVATLNRMAKAGEVPAAMKLPGKTGAYLFDRKVIEARAA